MAKILVVDDDESLRLMIADYLSNQGHECTPAENVAQACTHLSERSFELTISDFNMPSATGLDLLRYVSSNSPETSFILMSGETNARLRREALQLGAVACLEKPFRFRELLERVKSALEASQTIH